MPYFYLYANIKNRGSTLQRIVKIAQMQVATDKYDYKIMSAFV